MPDPQIVEALQNGAIIVDVRTPAEFSRGNVEGSLNIGLSSIGSEAAKLKKKKKAIVLCCRSGHRAGMAQSQLERKGLTCYNAGSWQKANKALKAANE